MKNVKTIITSSISILLSILIYVFLGQPYFGYSANIATSSVEGVKTGYELIRQLFQGGSGNFASTLMVISLFILSILAGLVIICSIYNLLVSTSFIKGNEKLNKVVSIVNMVLSLVVVVLSVVVISCTASYLHNGLDLSIAENAVEGLKSAGMADVTAEYILQNLLSNLNSSIGFANIVNLIFGILLGGTSVYGFIASKNQD